MRLGLRGDRIFLSGYEWLLRSRSGQYIVRVDERTDIARIVVETGRPLRFRIGSREIRVPPGRTTILYRVDGDEIISAPMSASMDWLSPLPRLSREELYVGYDPREYPLDRVVRRLGWLHPSLPMVSIIILNYQGIEYTVPCIESIYRHTSHPYELIVLDNYSDEANIEGLRRLVGEKLPIPFTLVLQSGRCGFSAACNYGITLAGGRYILLLNNDTLCVEDYWLSKMIRYMEDYGATIAGARLIFPDGRIQHVGGSPIFSGVYHPHHGERADDRFRQPRLVDWCTGACLLIDRRLVDEIGYLDTRFYSGWEDVDYCIRARMAGYKVIYAPVTLIHYEGATDRKLGLKKTSGRIFYEKWRSILPEGWGGYA